MVFKKPYAFLIKNFKIIHLILSAFIIFIIIQYRSVSGFFSEYAKGQIKPTYGLAQMYINNLLYLAIFIVIAFALAMFILMHKKQKPTLFYIVTFVYYLLMLIAILYASSVMKSLEGAVLTQSAFRTYRDIYFILSVPQYYFIIQSLIRGIGFDVKRFNFTKDLNELKINSEDNEEFEFVLGNDTYIYERKIRRILRETKYYILENKLIFMIIGTIAGIFFVGYLILNFNLINKTYGIGKGGTINGLYYKMNSAYISEYDYNGNIIKAGYKYIIINMTIRNDTTRARSIENINFFLTYGNNIAYNKPSLRNYFIDIGETYIGDDISANTTKDLIFIFEIDSKTKINRCNIKVLSETVLDKNNQTNYIYTDFKFKPKSINEAPQRLESKLKEGMFLGETLYKDSKLIITNAEIVTKYEYKYQSCKNNVCQDLYDIISPQDPVNQQLLVINYKLEINQNSGLNASMKTHKFFFDKYLKLEYNYNGKTTIKNLTVRVFPALDNMLFIDVTKASVSSDKTNIMISTRDYHYYINYKKIS